MRKVHGDHITGLDPLCDMRVVLLPFKHVSWHKSGIELFFGESVIQEIRHADVICGQITSMEQPGPLDCNDETQVEKIGYPMRNVDYL